MVTPACSSRHRRCGRIPATTAVPTVAVLGHSVLVSVPVPHGRLLLVLCGWTQVLFHLQFDFLLWILQSAMRNSVVEVHDQSWKGRGAPKSVRYKFVSTSLCFSSPPSDIQTVNRTKVRILSLKIRYTLTVIAMVGMNGSPGVRNARAYLGREETEIIQSNIY